MAETKRYGLILPKKSQMTVSKLAIFRDSDDEDVKDTSSNPISKPPKKEPHVKKQTLNEIEKIMKEDPMVYEYDSIYDEMQNKKEGKKILEKERKPKYITALLKSAEARKKESERRIERKIQLEREEEGEAYEDKESFVTSAYKQKMQEMQEDEERERQEKRLEDMMSVTKQKDLSGFYRHLLKQTTGEEKVPDFGSKVPVEKISKEKKSSSLNSTSSNLPHTKRNDHSDHSDSGPEHSSFKTNKESRHKSSTDSSKQKHEKRHHSDYKSRASKDNSYADSTYRTSSSSHSRHDKSDSKKELPSHHKHRSSDKSKTDLKDTSKYNTQEIRTSKQSSHFNEDADSDLGSTSSSSSDSSSKKPRSSGKDYKKRRVDDNKDFKDSRHEKLKSQEQRTEVRSKTVNISERKDKALSDKSSDSSDNHKSLKGSSHKYKNKEKKEEESKHHSKHYRETQTDSKEREKLDTKISKDPIEKSDGERNNKDELQDVEKQTDPLRESDSPVPVNSNSVSKFVKRHTGEAVNEARARYLARKQAREAAKLA